MKTSKLFLFFGVLISGCGGGGGDSGGSYKTPTINEATVLPNLRKVNLDSVGNFYALDSRNDGHLHGKIKHWKHSPVDDVLVPVKIYAVPNVAEALVCCQRYEAAIERCKTLLDDSLDRKYIVAETRWRMADVDGALAEISSASCRDSYDELACKKCVDLGARLLRLKDLMARAEREMEDEQFTTAIRCFDKVLETPEGKMMTRLRGKILRDRASCQLKRHEYDSRDDPIASENLASALRDLNECLKIDGNDHEAHVTRASVRACRGDHHGAFTDLRAAQTVAPTLPGIDDMVRVSAVRALRRSSGEDASTIASFTEESTARGGKFYDILGVSPDASARAVTSAYRKLAAVWHPDKWTRADPADAQEAEEKFTSIQRAHATLSDAKQHKMYDLDPARFEA